VKLKHFAKANTIIPSAPVDNTVISDISISKLIDQGLLTLSREIKNLTVLSVAGKLSPNDARDLRDHLKLLFEMRAMENDALRNMSDDELKALASKALE
jgi:hypothetical protein